MLYAKARPVNQRAELEMDLKGSLNEQRGRNDCRKAAAVAWVSGFQPGQRYASRNLEMDSGRKSNIRCS
ncbi:hypothetical protein PaeBR_07085 [Paenibacillus sp. BR2-3]|uniref:hypothetical protein n=1 Tax=Paenibacillus sp. BR2-3 TaxID=3048494 RepID=UPI0039772B14